MVRWEQAGFTKGGEILADIGGVYPPTIQKERAVGGGGF